MGQYYRTVNKDRGEYIDAHRLGSGLKLWEQLNNPGPAKALLLLTAYGGTNDLMKCYPYNEDTQLVYEKVAAVAGRWAYDRIVTVGDEGEDVELYFRCEDFTDITDLVASVLREFTVDY